MIYNIEQSFPSWDVLLISESDQVRSTSFSFDLSPHLSWRHWPGDGSFALRIVVNSRIRHLCPFDARFEGRCGLVSLGPSDAHKGLRRDGANFVLIHGSHDDLNTDIADLTFRASSVTISQVKPFRLVIGIVTRFPPWIVTLSPTFLHVPSTILRDGCC